MKTTIILGSAILIAGLKGGQAAEAQAFPAPTIVRVPPTPGQTEAEVLAEYNARRDKIGDTASAHYGLGLWCEQNGLKSEAMAHFATTIRLDPGREAAWKHLGFKKHQGRWMTTEQVSECNAQTKSDREWETRLRRWKLWLASKLKSDEAKAALAGVTDPRAVRSICQVFAAGGARDQELAVQLLGQVRCRAASRALALLAVSGESTEVRRAATESLGWRDPCEFADVLIGLLRDPLKYQVLPVEGPGMPGSVTVSGSSFNTERIYTSPPPPDIPIFSGDALKFDANGLPTIMSFTDSTALPFAWVKGSYTIPSGCIIPPHVPVPIQLGRMWVENWKSARSAQQQLRGDVAAIEQFNDLRRAANAKVVSVLNQAAGERLPVERTAWCAWWWAQLGRTYIPRAERPRPTLTEIVPPQYLPHDVGGLGFDPTAGYYLRVDTFGR